MLRKAGPFDRKEVQRFMTAKYEAMLIFTVKDGEDKTKELVEKFKALIEKNGSLESVDEWGKRRLAYAIDDQPEGYYALYNFESEGTLPAELERVAKITDGVLRVLTVRK